MSLDGSPRKKNEKLDKVNLYFFTLVPLLTVVFVAFYLTYFTLPLSIIIFSLIFAAATNLSITVGYHRLFSHRSFQTNGLIRFLLLMVGASGYQGSALKWSSDHRRHHNKVDTEEDPYAITEGFWHAHMGWLFFRDPSLEKIKAPDLEEDRMIAWQHNNYVLISIITGFVFPTIVGAFFGDPLGGFIFGGALRIVLTQQSTFFVNSLCHTLGTRPYSLAITARDSFFVAILTHGEGYHNFHHRFQTDYRNGIKWYHWDPTKWTIKTLALVGMAKNLRKIPQQEILKARLQVDALKIKSKGFSEEKIQLVREQILSAQNKIKHLQAEYAHLKEEYAKLKKEKNEAWHRKLAEIKLDMETARIEFNAGMQLWRAYLAHA